MRRLFSKRWLLIGLILLTAAGGIAWVFRGDLLAWHNLRGLASAGKDERDIWIQRLAALETAAVPGLLDQLASNNPQTVSNAQAALAYIAGRWGASDVRTLGLSGKLTDRFSSLGPAGQEAVLEWHLAQLQAQPPVQELVAAATRLLAVAAPSPESGVRARSLALLNKLPGATLHACLENCRMLIVHELQAPEALNRIQALHVLSDPELQKDAALVKQALPLLNDSDAMVRRAAVLAVGLARDVIETEELLKVMRDADREVRRLAELALKQRGLSASEILVGSLLTDPRPQVRLQVLMELPDLMDLDPAPWLQRLSQDSAPAVRGAAAKAITMYHAATLGTRLQQMAQDDPSPTVRQIAAAALTCDP